MGVKNPNGMENLNNTTGISPAIAPNAPLVMAPLAPTSIVGRVTSIARSKKSGLRHYALSLRRQGLVAGLRVGDVVQMMVVIQTPSGPYYNGVLEGTVVRVTPNKVRIYLHADYRPVVEPAYANNWAVLVYFITKKSGGGTS